MKHLILFLTIISSFGFQSNLLAQEKGKVSGKVTSYRDSDGDDGTIDCFVTLTTKEGKKIDVVVENNEKLCDRFFAKHGSNSIAEGELRGSRIIVNVSFHSE